MTVSYSLDVSSSKFYHFSKLLFRWRGSLWKSVYQSLFLWLVSYFTLSVIYRILLTDDQKVLFEKMVAYFHESSDYIPLTFMLGFYVTLVINRWWDMVMLLGWIDNTSIYTATYLRGTEEKPRMMRRSIIRYVVLCQAMIFRDINTTVRRRFPTYESLQAAGLLTATEVKLLDKVSCRSFKNWLPIHWAFDIIHKARQDGYIATNRAMELVHEQIRVIRTGWARLNRYDWCPVPLLYTQAVFLTVRCYFAVAAVGRQYVGNTSRISVERVILASCFVQFTIYSHGLHMTPNMPIFTVHLRYMPLADRSLHPVADDLAVHFLLRMDVAEVLLNPHGEDDDDFECNWLLDRNLKFGLCNVDEVIGHEPPLEKDIFWDVSDPELLYSRRSAVVPVHPYIGSALREASHANLNDHWAAEKVIMIHHAPDEYHRDCHDRECKDEHCRISKHRWMKTPQISSDRRNYSSPSLATILMGRSHYSTSSLRRCSKNDLENLDDATDSVNVHDGGIFRSGRILVEGSSSLGHDNPTMLNVNKRSISKVDEQDESSEKNDKEIDVDDSDDRK